MTVLDQRMKRRHEAIAGLLKAYERMCRLERHGLMSAEIERFLVQNFLVELLGCTLEDVEAHMPADSKEGDEK